MFQIWKVSEWLKIHFLLPAISKNYLHQIDNLSKPYKSTAHQSVWFSIKFWHHSFHKKFQLDIWRNQKLQHKLPFRGLKKRLTLWFNSFFCKSCTKLSWWIFENNYKKPSNKKSKKQKQNVAKELSLFNFRNMFTSGLDFGTFTIQVVCKWSSRSYNITNNDSLHQQHNSDTT